jgi:hypothetical protein
MAEMALGVTVLWGRDVLATRHLAEGEWAAVGEAEESLAPLPVEPFVFGAVVGGRGICHVPAGQRGFKRRNDGVSELLFGPSDIELRVGEEIRVPVGAFTLLAVGGPRAILPARAGRPQRGRRRHLGAPGLIAIVSAVALAHVAALTLGLLGRPDREPSPLAAETAAEVRMLLAEASERATSDEDGFDEQPPSQSHETAPDGASLEEPSAPNADHDVLASFPPGSSERPDLTCRAGESPVSTPPTASLAGTTDRDGAFLGVLAPGAGLVAFLGLGALALRGRLRG